MRISGARTVEEFKRIRTEKIEKWIDNTFVKGSVKWEMSGNNAIKVTDKKGDSMIIKLDDID